VPLADSYTAELALLRRAHAAYGSHDFTAALRLLAEHGSRFPNGRLAEEREALRVRALSGSGLNEAARVAAHSFAARFPHSVLLSRTVEAASTGR
jgi:outer membrane protein assembly factor BamD (BamD/ComL family)